MESLNLDLCCLSETRIQEPTSLLLHSSTSNKAWRLRLSGDPAAARNAGVGIVLSPRAENALLDWIPINSRLCAVRLSGSTKKERQGRPQTLLLIAAYAPTDCSPQSVKDSFYQQLEGLFQRKRRSDIVILAGDLNAQVGRLNRDEAILGGTHGFSSRRTDNGERLLHFCSSIGLFIATTNVRNPLRRRAT